MALVAIEYEGTVHAVVNTSEFVGLYSSQAGDGGTMICMSVVSGLSIHVPVPIKVVMDCLEKTGTTDLSSEMPRLRDEMTGRSTGNTDTDLLSMVKAKAYVMVEDEREACAKMVDDSYGKHRETVAHEIRKRGNVQW